MSPLIRAVGPWWVPELGRTEAVPPGEQNPVRLILGGARENMRYASDNGLWPGALAGICDRRWTGKEAAMADLLSLGQVKELAGHEGGPCVSVFLPAHRMTPDSGQDPIRLRNLLNEAEERLVAGGLRARGAGGSPAGP